MARATPGKPGESAGEVRLTRSDLPREHRGRATDAVLALYKAHVADAEKDGRAAASKRGEEKKGKSARWTDFAKALKSELDQSLGPHWHVLIGGSVGFACKSRQETVCTWRAGSSMVVAWKSPGVEGPSPAVEAAAAVPADAEATAPALRVLHPGEVAEGAEVATALATLRGALKSARVQAGAADGAAADVELLARVVRRELCAEMGPIWHVVVGSDFVVEPAEDCRNHLVVLSGKTKIACFQHEQLAESRLDVQRLQRALSLSVLVLALLLCGIMQTYCTDEPLDPATEVVAVYLRSRFCHEGWQDKTTAIGLVALAAVLVNRRSSLQSIFRRRR